VAFCFIQTLKLPIFLLCWNYFFVWTFEVLHLFRKRLFPKGEFSPHDFSPKGNFPKHPGIFIVTTYPDLCNLT
jgi:hypothetical protein